MAVNVTNAKEYQDKLNKADSQQGKTEVCQEFVNEYLQGANSLNKEVITSFFLQIAKLGFDTLNNPFINYIQGLIKNGCTPTGEQYDKVNELYSSNVLLHDDFDISKAKNDSVLFNQTLYKQSTSSMEFIIKASFWLADYSKLKSTINSVPFMNAVVKDSIPEAMKTDENYSYKIMNNEELLQKELNEFIPHENLIAKQDFEKDDSDKPTKPVEPMKFNHGLKEDITENTLAKYKKSRDSFFAKYLKDIRDFILFGTRDSSSVNYTTEILDANEIKKIIVNMHVDDSLINNLAGKDIDSNIYYNAVATNAYTLDSKRWRNLLVDNKLTPDKMTAKEARDLITYLSQTFKLNEK